MKHIYRWIIASLLIMLSSPCLAGEETGGHAGSFLNWGVGARAIAMGKTFSAIADDGTALFWNPGGLGQAKIRELSTMQALIFEDRREIYVGFSHPVYGFAISAGWLHFGVNDIQERNEVGELLGHFGDSENAFMLGSGTTVYSTPVITLNVGTTIKYFHHSLHEYHANGWGADFGTLLHLHQGGIVDHIGIAAVIQNVGARVKWNTESNHEDQIPTAVRLGSAIAFRSLPLTFACDLEKQRDRDIRVHLGSEYWWQTLALRAGLNHDQLTAGAGFVFAVSQLDFLIDYAFTDDAISTKGLHFFSLHFKL